MEACGESAGVRQLRAAAADLVFGCGTSLELPFETCCLAALILQRFACTSHSTRSIQTLWPGRAGSPRG
ncbi:hypothetical protein FNF29_08395 [Cafeteria roenbergensis]|uniref:Uncharacterized protein n=1 Tax=Cafeteria roenbergensis TaxID=33653 RepID=A0A5A8BZ88_CAFRO|nr:hypothetical protein FNF29_08395 [Cafeteria roenbergensis]|eukprot:KAA0145775.1 hypothetical protein FNF29_08395 [Cafeteria roenbergensis]